MAGLRQIVNVRVTRLLKNLQFRVRHHRGEEDQCRHLRAHCTTHTKRSHLAIFVSPTVLGALADHVRKVDALAKHVARLTQIINVDYSRTRLISPLALPVARCAVPVR